MPCGGGAPPVARRLTAFPLVGYQARPKFCLSNRFFCHWKAELQKENASPLVFWFCHPLERVLCWGLAQSSVEGGRMDKKAEAKAIELLSTKKDDSSITYADIERKAGCSRRLLMGLIAEF